jgi:hypothetical protein
MVHRNNYNQSIPEQIILLAERTRTGGFLFGFVLSPGITKPEMPEAVDSAVNMGLFY